RHHELAVKCEVPRAVSCEKDAGPGGPWFYHRLYGIKLIGQARLIRHRKRIEWAWRFRRRQFSFALSIYSQITCVAGGRLIDQDKDTAAEDDRNYRKSAADGERAMKP